MPLAPRGLAASRLAQQRHRTRLRPIALHRKNSLFSASQAGAEGYATLLTVTQSALLHELDPIAYLNNIIDDLHHERRTAAELTPAQYARRRGVVGKLGS